MMLPAGQRASGGDAPKAPVRCMVWIIIGIVVIAALIIGAVVWSDRHR
jgi:hypothetical protein